MRPPRPAAGQFLTTSKRRLNIQFRNHSPGHLSQKNENVPTPRRAHVCLAASFVVAERRDPAGRRPWRLGAEAACGRRRSAAGPWRERVRPGQLWSPVVRSGGAALEGPRPSDWVYVNFLEREAWWCRGGRPRQGGDGERLRRGSAAALHGRPAVQGLEKPTPVVKLHTPAHRRRKCVKSWCHSVNGVSASARGAPGGAGDGCADAVVFASSCGS